MLSFFLIILFIEKAMKTLLLVLVLIFNCTFSFAQEVTGNSKVYHLIDQDFKYTKPTPFEFATTLPQNAWRFLDSSFSTKYLNAWGIIILSTGVLIVYDQKITNQVQRFGRFLGLGNNENTVATLRVGGSPLLRRPSDVGSAMYFIGDGWVTIGFMSGFFVTGLVKDSPRSLQVASQLFQGLLLTGLTTQIIKRSTGRESPIRSSKPGGRWKFFPKTSDYQETISKYDAFPSGHLATTMTTFMILSENYPEYHFIKPIGITAMALLSFQMVNNSVHWAGDYPLALGIGYMIGKTIVENGREKLNKDPNQTQSYFTPMLDPSGKIGLAWNLDY